MNGSGDIPLALGSSPDTRPCGFTSIIPTLGMSSCRGRAEAFARRLSSKLKTLGSQTDEDPISQEDEPIINGGSNNTWMTSHESEKTVTDLQPLRHESDSFFDFDCELESPGSPVDECEYLRLIETASNTPHTSAPESGYVCASAASSQGSTEGPYSDVEGSEKLRNQNQSRKTLPAEEILQYVNSLKLNGNATTEERLSNGHSHENFDTEEYEIKHDELNENNTEHLMEKPLPIMGNNLIETATEKETLGKCDEEVGTLEMVRVQDEIITELQKQSEQITENNTALTIVSQSEDETECMTPTNFVDVTKPVEQKNAAKDISSVIYNNILGDALMSSVEEPPKQNVFLAENSNSSATENADIKTSEVTHTITNGHLEDEDEVLKIETTELESPIQGQDVVDHAVCRESHTKQYVQSQETILQIESPESPTEETKKLTVEVVKNETTRIHHSVLDTTDDEDDCRPQRVRRCSSLKTGKTPPGTPGRKKIVRFADVLGLDLADVKTFLDEIPTIPKSAFEDLDMMDSEPPMQLGPKTDRLLMPLFQQPGGLTTFLDLVRVKQVSLENAAITDPINQLITGSVRVRNLDFHKSVHIRYTVDGWRSYADLQANYVQNSCDGFSDKYTFVLFGNSLQIGQRLEFAVRFQCKGQQFWDNNYGTNYCFQCLPTSSPTISPIQTIVASQQTNCNAVGQLSPSVGEAWCTSFY